MKKHNVYITELEGIMDCGDKHTSIWQKEKGLVTSLTDVLDKTFWEFDGKNVRIKISIDVEELWV